MSELSSKLNKITSDDEGDGRADTPRRLKSARVTVLPQPTPPTATGLRDMLALIRGNIALILLMILLSLGAGWAYLTFSPPRYVASATLLVDPESATVPQEYYIESQTQMMRSDPVVRAVVDQLGLVNAGIAKDDEALFIDQARAAKRYLGQFIPALASAEKSGDKVQEAMQTLRRNLTISRPAMTPIMTISYDSTDAARAAAIVSTLIDTYGVQRRDGEMAAMQQSVVWLTQRLSELRLQYETAERAVESFRAANNIVGSGSNQSLLAEQRLYELSMQLEAARAGAGDAVPSLGVQPDASDRTTGILPERRVAALDSGIATDAPQPVGVQRPVATPTSEPSEATRQLAALQGAFEEASLKVREINRQGARLRELEASTETYRTLYGKMQLRYEEAVQQTMVPEHDGVQVLIAAQQPRNPSHPRPLLVIVFAVAFGVALGVGAAVLREWLALEPADPA